MAGRYTLSMRERVRRLVALGFTQKAVAAKIGVEPSVLSKWLNGKTNKSLSVDALEGLDNLENEIRDTLAEKETQRAPKSPPDAAAGKEFRRRSS